MNEIVAVERNRKALIRILAALVAMAGLGSGEGAATLPRSLRLAVLRLLRPAESATRRLIIVLAHGLVVTLPPSRSRKPKQQPTILLNGVGTGILMPRAAVSGASYPVAPHTLNLPLVDPLQRPFRRRRPTRGGVPRISVPGFTAPFPAADRRLPDDAVYAARLGRRLESLGRALDDLMHQARRFARWRARRDRWLARGFMRRQSPLRLGRPPGGRLSHYDPLAARRRNVREVDEILAHAHALAVHALRRPDTS